MSTFEQQYAAAKTQLADARTKYDQAQEAFTNIKTRLAKVSTETTDAALIASINSELKAAGEVRSAALTEYHNAENALINIEMGKPSNMQGGSSDEVVITDKEASAVKSNSTRVSGSEVTQDLVVTAGKKESQPEKQTKNAVTAKSIPTYKSKPNELHQYATYTYGISLYVLGKEEYNSLVKNPKSFSPNKANCLIANAGVHGAAKKRNKYWNDDFYFDGLKMTTIIGFNSTSRGANAIDLSFTIIEPMGFTLIDRLLQTSYEINSKTPGNDTKDAPNYIAMPYLLQIEFFGYDDQGKQQNLSRFTKYIPIRMLSCKSKVSSKGSEYNIQASPYNHQGFNETTASSPCNIEVSAKTVGDFFADNLEDVKEIQRISQLKREGVGEGDKQREEKLKASGQVGEKYMAAMKTATTAKVKSYAGAYNAWENDLVKNKQKQYASPIRFVIDDDIKNATFSAGKKTDSSKTTMVDPKDPKVVSAQAKSNDKNNANNENNIDSNVEISAIRAGDNVLHIINKIVINSSYITDQLTDPLTGKNISGTPEEVEKMTKNKAPLNWFKVIPEVTLNEFDYGKNAWSATTTYHIKKCAYYNDKVPLAPKSMVNGVVKEYNYIYTGLNTDIIDFDIDFDTLFYTAITVDRAKFLALNDSDSSAESGKTEGSLQTANANSAQPLVIQHRVDDKQNLSGYSSTETVTRAAASDVAKSVYGATDMVKLNLKIVGDPEFIKQDDLFFNPGSNSYNDKGQNIETGQSLVMDAGEIFATVKFKTPVDYDDNTGGIRTDPSYKVGVFSGLFRIMKVDSEFRNGKFEQNLEMIRIFQQPEFDVIGKKTTQTSQRSKPIKSSVDIKKLTETNIDSNKSDADIIAEATKKAEEESGSRQTDEDYERSVQDSLDSLRDMPDEQVKLREEAKEYEEFSYDEYVDGYGD